jgi:hypothetical protein
MVVLAEHSSNSEPVCGDHDPVETSSLQPHQARQRQHRLSPDEVGQLLARRAAGSTILQLASEFGVHRTTVIAHLRRSTPLRHGATS